MSTLQVSGLKLKRGESVDTCTCFGAVSSCASLVGHRLVCYLFAHRHVSLLPASTPALLERLSPCVVSSSIAFLPRPWLRDCSV